MLAAVGAFAVGSVVLVLAAVALTRAADELAVRTGIGRLLAGMLLLALATSLPEMLTSVSATLGDAPDIAVGGLFGSNMANIAILAFVDLAGRGRVWPAVELGQARLAAVAIALTALAALGVSIRSGAAVGWVGVDSLAIVAVYIAAVAWMRRSPTTRRLGTQPLPTPTALERTDRDLRGPAVRFAAATLLLVASAPVVAAAAEDLSAETGLGETFVGAAFLAITTSLPELVGAIAALRIGAPDLAVGNLLGSNAANMAILVSVDLAHTEGPVLSSVGTEQLAPAIISIFLVAMAQAAIVHGEETRVGKLEPDALILLMAYFVGLVVVGGVAA